MSEAVYTLATSIDCAIAQVGGSCSLKRAACMSTKVLEPTPTQMFVPSITYQYVGQDLYSSGSSP